MQTRKIARLTERQSSRPTFVSSIVVLMLTAAFSTAIGQADVPQSIEAVETSLAELDGAGRLDALLFLAEAYAERDPGTGRQYAKQAQTLADELGDLQRKAAAMFWEGVAIYHTRDYEATLATVAEGIVDATANSDFRNVCRLEQLRGMVHQQRGERRAALRQLRGALESCDRADAGDVYGSVHGNLAILYSDMGDTETAIQMFAAQIEKEGDLLGTGDVEWRAIDLARTQANLAIAYQQEQDYAKATPLFRQSLAFAQASGNIVGIAVTASGLARSLAKLGQFDEAASFAQLAVPLYEQFDDPDGIAHLLQTEAIIALGTNDVDRSVTLLRQAIGAYQGTAEPTTDVQVELLRSLGQSLALRGDFEEAFEVTQRAGSLAEEFAQQERASVVGELQAELNILQKDLEIGRLAASQERASLALHNQRNRIIQALVVISCLAIIAVIAIGSAKKRARLNDQLRYSNGQLEELVALRDTLLREVNHRVKNNLQVILSLLELQLNRLGQTDRGARADARDTLTDVRGRIEAMALIHKNLQEADSSVTIGMAGFLEDLGRQISALYQETASISIHSDDIALDINTAIPISLIVNELVSNAARHAFTGATLDPTVAITLVRGTESDIQLCVSDNGGGFDERDAGEKGLGIFLVESLVRQLSASLNRTNELAGGTRWTIVVPTGASRNT